jgi:GNAT superfamily N-acetyltransferase
VIGISQGAELGTNVTVHSRLWISSPVKKFTIFEYPSSGDYLIMQLDVRPATTTELPIVCTLLDQARDWHVRNTPSEVWPVFDRLAMAELIEGGHVFVGVERLSGRVIGTFTLTEDDPHIWGEDSLPAFYIHKLVSKRSLTGQQIGAKLIEWIVQRGISLEKQALRCDTWATNSGLKRYYEAQGFQHVATKSFPLDAPLPDHYRGASMNLFERLIA